MSSRPSWENSSAHPKGHHEQPRTAVVSRARVARWRSFAIIDLRFLTRRRFEPTLDLRFARPQLADEPLNGIVRPFVAVVVDEMLVDRYAMAAFGEFGFDDGSVRFATAARLSRVGGHFGRF